MQRTCPPAAAGSGPEPALLARWRSLTARGSSGVSRHRPAVRPVRTDPSTSTSGQGVNATHMLADLVELARRVDPPNHTPTAAVVAAATGALVEQLTVPATPAGDQQLLRLADRPHGRRGWAMERTGGSGAGRTRPLAARAEQVVELDRPKRAARRHGVKADPLDATRAAREALGGQPLAQPRATGHRAARSVRLAARRSAVPATPTPTPAPRPGRGRPDTLGARLRQLPTPRLVSTCGRLRLRATWELETTATAASLRAPARRIQLLNAATLDHTRAITTLVRAWRPELLTRCRVGPIVAAIVRCAWSIPAAGHATLPWPCSAARPPPASSGQRSGCGAIAPAIAASTRPST
jgi:transposase